MIALLAALALISVWNALRYPPGGGYDAIDHIAYAEGIRQGDGLPDGTGEYYTPPAFYTLAAGAIELGDRLGLGDPHRMAQLLNACSRVRDGAPPPRARGGSSGPDAMCSTSRRLPSSSAAHSCSRRLRCSTPSRSISSSRLSRSAAPARMIVRDDYRPVLAVSRSAPCSAPANSSALSPCGRSQSSCSRSRGPRSSIRLDGGESSPPALIAVAATAVVAGPWYAHQSRSYTNPIFDQPQVTKPLLERRPIEFYVDPGLPELGSPRIGRRS